MSARICSTSTKMRLRCGAAVLVAAVVAVAGKSNGGRATVVGGGYEGVLVTISPSLEENKATEIIEGVKVALTEASEVLYRATRGATYFKHIKILLPKTWTNTNFDEASQNENYEDGDIRVDSANPVYGGQPYTVQPGGCGVGGQYIQLTPSYLTDDTVAAGWGPRGKTLVHEWAKYRWGVFDEFGYPYDPAFPLFYWSILITPEVISRVPTPNYCADTVLKGVLRDVFTMRSCSYGEDGLPDPNCRFVPDLDQPAASSLMSYYYLNNIEEFCDSQSDELYPHDPYVPHRQNLMCDGRSVWDIMLQHPDFALNSTRSFYNISTNTTPMFTVLRQEEANFALVLDYSGSMNDFERIQKLQQTAQRWILYEVADGSSVAIVRFSSTALVVANLTVVSNATRQDLALLVTTDPTGGTSIGSGLLLAVGDPGVLKDKKNGVILLVTDGEENSPPSISEVMPKVISSGVRVVTIAFGKDADPTLETLAQNTDGKTYTVLDEDDGGMLDDAFLGALTYQPAGDLADLRVKIHDHEYRGTDTIVSAIFHVDATVGRNLQLRLDTDKDTTVILSPILIGPNSTLISGAEFDNVTNMWMIDVPLAEAGKWMWAVRVSGSEEHYISVGVTAQARDPESSPILTRAWMSAGSEGVNATTNPVIIYAEVSQGNHPVVGAMVRAYVSQPDTNAKAVELYLLDNGQSADTQAGDGIYSRYMTNYTTIGRYAVKAQVWDEGSAYINNGFTTSRKTQDLLAVLGLLHHPLALGTSPRHPRSLPVHPLDTPYYCCGSVVPFDSSQATPTGAFTRLASGGSFQVTAIPMGDVFPPSRVTDLRADLLTASHLNLTWTATGEDLDAGTVYGYELRLTRNRSELTEANFDAGGEANLALSLNDSRKFSDLLVEAGAQVVHNLTLEEDLEKEATVFLALKAVDSAGNKSPVSNLAVVVPGGGSSTGPGPLPWWGVTIIAVSTMALVACLLVAIHKQKH